MAEFFRLDCLIRRGKTISYRLPLHGGFDGVTEQKMQRAFYSKLLFFRKFSVVVLLLTAVAAGRVAINLKQAFQFVKI